MATISLPTHRIFDCKTPWHSWFARSTATPLATTSAVPPRIRIFRTIAQLQCLHQKARHWRSGTKMVFATTIATIAVHKHYFCKDVRGCSRRLQGGTSVCCSIFGKVYSPNIVLELRHIPSTQTPPQLPQNGSYNRGYFRSGRTAALQLDITGPHVQSLRNHESSRVPFRSNSLCGGTSEVLCA